MEAIISLCLSLTAVILPVLTLAVGVEFVVKPYSKKALARYIVRKQIHRMYGDMDISHILPLDEVFDEVYEQEENKKTPAPSETGQDSLSDKASA